MPKISVIMTVYNLKPYVRRAVQSVMAQTMPDFELIIVNDGSYDGSAALLNELARPEPRIRVFHTENRGVSQARNMGMEQASGAWLTFLDGDDFYYPHALETMYAKTGDCDIVVANYALVYGNDADPPFYHLPTEAAVNRPDRVAGFLEARLEIGESAMNKLYRREFLMATGVRFEPREEIFAEDSFFNAQLLRDAGKICIADQVVAGCCQRHGSETYSCKEDLAARCIRFLDRLSQWYGHSCDDALKVRAVRLYGEVLRNEAMKNYPAFRKVVRDRRFRTWIKGADQRHLTRNRRTQLMLLPFAPVLYMALRRRRKRVLAGLR